MATDKAADGDEPSSRGRGCPAAAWIAVRASPADIRASPKPKVWTLFALPLCHIPLMSEQLPRTAQARRSSSLVAPGGRLKDRLSARHLQHYASR